MKNTKGRRTKKAYVPPQLEKHESLRKVTAQGTGVMQQIVRG